MGKKKNSFASSIVIYSLGHVAILGETVPYAVIVAAVLFIALWVIVYFAFFCRTDTGTNADEKLE